MDGNDHLSQQNPPGGPAFPVSIAGCGDNGWHGMSLRDWFAGQMLASDVDAPSYEELAAKCYAMADAMLEARKSKPTQE